MGSGISEIENEAKGQEQERFFKKEYFWWNPKDGSSTASFCLDSSLHGLKYLGQRDRHISERILWGVVVFVSVLASAYFISTVLETYNRNPIVVVFNSEETAIENIPFPAVTVCNINNIQKSRAEQYFRDAKGHTSQWKTHDAQRKLYYLDNICSTSPAFSRKFNYSLAVTETDPNLYRAANLSKRDDSQGDISNFFAEASQDCNQLIRLCSWRGEIFPCHKLFQGIETDYGFCCVFNMVPQSLLHRFRNDTRDNAENIQSWQHWNIEKDGLFLKRQRRKNKNGYPKRQKLPGKSSGLSILLDPDIEEYFCTNSDSVGFQIAVHLPIEVPHVVDKAIAVKPDSEVFVDLRPEITMAHRNILGFSLDKRSCYDHEEFPLFFYKYYTASNCIDECRANKTFEQCDCVRYYMPRDDNRGLCSNDKLSCTADVEKMFYDQGAEKFCSHCLPSCQEIHYYGETTLNPIRNAFNIWEDESGKAEWSGKNVSIVHIFFGSGRTYSRIRSELYGIIDLIANTGGLLGLCLGFSGISLIEIIYFLTLRAYCASKRRKKEAVKVYDDFLQTQNNWAKRTGNPNINMNFRTLYAGNSNKEMFYPDAKLSYWTADSMSRKQGHVAIDVNSFVK